MIITLEENLHKLIVGAKNGDNKSVNEEPSIPNILAQARELVSLLNEARKIVASLSGGLTNGEKPSVPQGKEIPPTLSPKEKEIWELFRDRLNVKQISEKLGIAEKTVEVHRDHIRKKLNLKSAKEFYDLVQGNLK